MWSLFGWAGVAFIFVDVVSGALFVVFDGGASCVGRVSCGVERGSVVPGVGASVTLGSTEANLGVVNGSEGCTGGVSNDPKKSNIQSQRNEERDLPKNQLVAFVDRVLSTLDLDSSATPFVSAFCSLRPSAIISL